MSGHVFNIPRVGGGVVAAAGLINLHGEPHGCCIREKLFGTKTSIKTDCEWKFTNTRVFVTCTIVMPARVPRSGHCSKNFMGDKSLRFL